MLDALTGIPVLAGFLLGLSLAAPLGPVNTLIAARTAAHGFWPGVAVGIGAGAADAVIFALVVLGGAELVGAVPGVTGVLALVGAGVMLVFAWRAYRSARAADMDVQEGARAGAGSVAAGFRAGFAIAIVHPYGLVWWLTVGTPLFVEQGFTLFGGVFLGILAPGFVYAAAVVWARARIQGLARGISYASAGILLAFGIGFLWYGGRVLAGLA